MKVGDLVMWAGKDQSHGMIGVITGTNWNNNTRTWSCDVQWSDGVHGFELKPCEIMAVINENR